MLDLKILFKTCTGGLTACCRDDAATLLLLLLLRNDVCVPLPSTSAEINKA